MKNSTQTDFPEDQNLSVRQYDPHYMLRAEMNPLRSLRKGVLFWRSNLSCSFVRNNFSSLEEMIPWASSVIIFSEFRVSIAIGFPPLWFNCDFDCDDCLCSQFVTELLIRNTLVKSILLFSNIFPHLIFEQGPMKRSFH